MTLRLVRRYGYCYYALLSLWFLTSYYEFCPVSDATNQGRLGLLVAAEEY